MHGFFISNTFISNTRLKLAKNQANAKQQLEAELLLFENYSHSSSMLSSKNNRTYSKNKQTKKCVCVLEIIRLIIMKMKMKMKNRSHKCDINRPCSKHGHKYSKYKKCLSMMTLICIKQYLRKSVTYKKRVQSNVKTPGTCSNSYQSVSCCNPYVKVNSLNYSTFPSL